MENTKTNIEMLNASISQYKSLKDDDKTNIDIKKSLGVMIAKLVCEGVKSQDKAFIDYINKQKEEKNEAFKTAKAFVSKGFRVGQAFVDGIFNEDNQQEVTTLYDILLKKEKEDKEVLNSLSEKRANEFKALSLALDTSDDMTVNKYILTASPLEYKAMLDTGLILLGEENEKQRLIDNQKEVLEKVTEFKAFTAMLFDSYPALFVEVMDDMLSYSDRVTKAA